jgi:hypothetical protein
MYSSKPFTVRTCNQLKNQIQRPEVGYDDAIWNTIANKFEGLAAEIRFFEGHLLRI